MLSDLDFRRTQLTVDRANEEEHLRDFHKVAKLAEKKANRGLRRKRNTTYCFDSVFGPDSTQEQVYQETTLDTVEIVFSGYNCSGAYITKIHLPHEPGVYLA